LLSAHSVETEKAGTRSTFCHFPGGKKRRRETIAAA